MKKHLQYIIAALLLCTHVKAQQDIHFSQFFSSPLNINPALTGMFDGDMRLTNNYRSQWASITVPYNTMSFAADFPVMRNYKNDNFMGIGVSFMNDVTGDSRLTSNQYGLSFSYIAKLNREQFLSFGIQTALMQRMMSYQSLSWSTQWDGTGFDPTFTSGENFGAERVSAIDFNFGTSWFYEIDDYNKVFAGVSIHHLAKPQISFQSQEERLMRKGMLHGGAELKVENTNIVFLPNFLLMKQGPNGLINFGSDIKYVLQEKSQITNFNDETALSFGAYVRPGDAVYLLSRIDFKGIGVGFSYDLNTSGLTAASNGLGGMEFMLTYRTSFRKGRGFNTPFL